LPIFLAGQESLWCNHVIEPLEWEWIIAIVIKAFSHEMELALDDNFM